MPIYDLYWNDGRMGCIVKADVYPDYMRKLVNKYKNTDEGYNIDNFIDFLKEKGINAELIICYESSTPVELTPVDYAIYF